MKKITSLLIVVFTIILFTKVNAAQIPAYFVNEAFTSAVAYPAGWADATSLIGTNNAGVSWTAPTTNQLSVAGSGSGTRGRSISFPTSGAETTVYVDFDFFITSAYIAQKNAFGIILHDNAGNNILSLYACGNDGKFHFWNKDLTTAVFIGGSFNKASSVNVAGTNDMNLTTQLDFPYASGTWFNLKATLDFSSHLVAQMTLTKKSDATSISETNLPFINTAATDITKISLVNTRSSIAGNGSNANLNVSIDNVQTYKLIEASVASVSVNYKDSEGNTLKASRVQTDLEVGSTYTATTDDKATFSDASFYYAYNSVASTDNVVVAAEGSEINLIFKKTAITTGTYSWTGSTSSVWNNADENFSTDGLNSIGYQNNNPVLFPSAASNKIVNLAADLTLGANDITLEGDGYEFSGIGSLTGSGKLILNTTAGQSTTVGIKSNLSSIQLNAGSALITNDLGSTSFIVGDGTTLKLQTGATCSKSIAGTGTITIEALSNNYYWMPVTGASTVNVVLHNAGTGTSATWSDYFGGSFPAGAQVNVTTPLAAAGFGVTGTLLTNNKVSIGDGVRLLNWYNQASSGGGTSVIGVGELSGTTMSTIEGGMVDSDIRHLAYEIGGLNTDATFDGVIKNFGAVTLAQLKMYKKGTGKWTLTGASTFNPGLFNVDAGTLELTGSLSGANVPVTVALDATLKGTGTIAGATTVNGTLEGRMNFGSSLVLAGTTKIAIGGFEAGQFDKVTVAGALTLGGALNVTVTASAPEVGTKIKILDAASYTGEVLLTAPNGYTFNNGTGELTYDLGSSLNQQKGLTIYPTLVRDMVQVNGQGITEINLISVTGQMIRSIQSVSENNTVNLSNLTNGAYLLKVVLSDGSVKIQNILLQK